MPSNFKRLLFHFLHQFRYRTIQATGQFENAFDLHALSPNLNQMDRVQMQIGPCREFHLGKLLALACTVNDLTKCLFERHLYSLAKMHTNIYTRTCDFWLIYKKIP